MDGRDGGDILAADIHLAIDHGVGLGCHDQAQAGARACPEAQVSLADVERTLGFRSGRAHELLGVAVDVVGHGHGFDGLLYVEDVLRIEDRLGLFVFMPVPIFMTRSSSSSVGIVHLYEKHEAIELGLGQWVCAFLLKRILSGQDKEWIRQKMSGASDCHAPLLHGLEHRSLCLGRSAVDFIRQYDVGEQRPCRNLNSLAPVTGS